MILARTLARNVLLVVFTASLLSPWLAPKDYARQDRERTNAPQSREFLLGTDELGRDRFSRLLYGSGISLALAPAAALLSTAVAVIVGCAAALLGGWCDRILMRVTELFLSIPWLFLFLTIRALLPLNTSPGASVGITFALMGLLGWAYPARIIRAGVRELKNSEYMLLARASGCGGSRLLRVHMLPNVQPLILAQFWISVPLFILAEASLGLLGLGVAEPLPSWGNLLRELENQQLGALNACVLAPVVLLVAIMACFQIVLPQQEVRG